MGKGKKYKGVKLSEPKMSFGQRRFWWADEAECHFATANRLDTEAKSNHISPEQRIKINKLVDALRTRGHKMVAKATSTSPPSPT